MTQASKRAVVLFSGGLDSTTCVALAQQQGFAVTALSVDYGQRHAIELQVASRLAAHMRVESHRVVSVDLRSIGGSALTSSLSVPKHQTAADIPASIPNTYVPARNMIFLSLAAALAEVQQAQDIFIGVNAVDYSGYPDCRPEFITQFEKTAHLATRAGVEGGRLRIHAPLSGLSKADIVKLGHAAGVDYALTHSCYDPTPDGSACAHCDSCLLRKKGFADAGLADPTRYA